MRARLCSCCVRVIGGYVCACGTYVGLYECGGVATIIHLVCECVCIVVYKTMHSHIHNAAFFTSFSSYFLRGR